MYFYIVIQLFKGFLSGLFLSAFYPKTLSLISDTCNTLRQFLSLDFITLAVYEEKRHSWTSSCYFLPLGFKYSPHQSVIKHP